MKTINNVYWREDSVIKEKKSKARLWVVFSFIFYFIYCGMLIVDALYFDGDMIITLITLLAALPLPVIPMFIYLKGIKTGNIPMFIATATNLAFLVFGTYMQVLDYHFFVLFITIGIVMVMKDYKLLLRTTVIISATNAVYIIAVMPHLEWLNYFRFTMQFIFFLFGSVFIMILTYSVDKKEGNSDRALAAITALLSSTPDLMAITDDSRRVVYLSNQFLKFIGYPRKEYTVGQPLIDLIFDWRLKMIFADMLDAEDYYETEIDLEIDGEDKHFKLTTNKLADGFAGIFIDISDITPIVHSKLVAEEASRSKSNFLATMSHEIRTPLNAIIGITQIQMQNEDLPPEYKISLDKVNSAGNHLLGIINDILDLSKIEAGNLDLHLSQYDIPSVVNDAVQLNIVRIGNKPIKFILDIDADMPSRLYGDELRLKQILNNLLSNAVKYTDKGEVKLSVSAKTFNNAKSTIDNGKLNNAENKNSKNYQFDKDDDIALTFTVSDTGQGILPEDRERLFAEQYIRLNAESNRTTEGTGLGLSIVKKLVEIMDGTISVSSQYGKGSVFTVTVKQKYVDAPPVGAETAKSLREFSYVDERFRERRKTVRNTMPYGSVLVVDDSESNLFVAEGLLSPYKVKVKTADSGFKALDAVRDGESFDIIFMDHMMPRMDGIETTKILREMGYTNPIIALTANALAGNETMFTNNGFDGYIPKPIDTRRLDRALNTFIRERHPEEAELHKQELNVQERTGRERTGQERPGRAETATDDFISPKLMEIFSREAENGIKTLRETLGNDDLKRFTITVHALKSALANVGQPDLSEQAKKLEYAGRDSDNAYISANIDIFIGGLEQFLDTIKVKNDKTGDGGDMQKSGGDMQKSGNDVPASSSEDLKFLREQLVIIITACECYDDEMVYGALDKISEKKWEHDITVMIENIRNKLFLDSDFEMAAAFANQLIGSV